jgi:hypothetical protein
MVLFLSFTNLIVQKKGITTAYSFKKRKMEKKVFFVVKSVGNAYYIVLKTKKIPLLNP